MNSRLKMRMKAMMNNLSFINQDNGVPVSTTELLNELRQ